MAVAVKNPPETGAASGPSVSVPTASLAGALYVIGSLGILFKLLPWLWKAAAAGLGVAPEGFASLTLLGLVMLVAATALLIVGVRLLGPKPTPGVKAGIFVALLFLLLVLLLTRWVSLWVDRLFFDHRWFGDSGPLYGSLIVAAFGLLFLYFFVRLFLRPGTQANIVAFENQGWFTAHSYKPSQGQRVRRATILGILLLVGAGVWTMVNHNTLGRGAKDWSIVIPFTGVNHVDVSDQASRGDVPPSALLDAAGASVPDVSREDLDKMPPAEADKALAKVGPLTINSYKLRDINDRTADPARFVKIYNPEGRDSKFRDGEVVPKSEFDADVQERKEANLGVYTPPDTVPPTPATGGLHFASLTLLPDVRYTVPLLLLALTLWLAWRIVNAPTFADFLIATEAELSKVSWTTKKRLYQDTIVVLVTVVLLAGYLFVMDQAWSHLLSWKPVGVVQLPEQSQQNKSVEQKRY
jgi:preprotein translocase SecE subunit